MLGDVMRVAVIGHVELVVFARVALVPRPGEIARATSSWEQAGGGGGAAAKELARLVATDDCVEAAFFTAIGEGDAGTRVEHALSALPLGLHVASRTEPHPRVFTLVDDAGERTITVLAAPLAPRGDDPLGWGALDHFDAAYFVKGDAAAARQARRARVLVATARVLPILREAAVKVDVLVRSARDASERYSAGDLEIAPAVVVATEGAEGGCFETADGRRGRWSAAATPEPIVDSYGAGDAFAAAITFALARGLPLQDALTFAADRGAHALGRRGAGDDVR